MPARPRKHRDMGCEYQYIQHADMDGNWTYRHRLRLPEILWNYRQRQSFQNIHEMKDNNNLITR